MEIKQICEIFRIKGELKEYSAIKTGNINKTYKVTYESDGRTFDYIVQDINKFVFKNPEHIMENIKGVTEHISKKYNEQESEKYVLNFLQTEDGVNFFIDGDNRFLRAYRFIPRSVTYDTFDDLGVLKNAGEAFGRFQMQLADFDASTLYEIIPNFHNTASRYEALEASASKDAYGRLEEAKELYDSLIANKATATSLVKMLSDGSIPLRVTHNDTKCNNVLFDFETGEPLAVIDLDTVMPGLTAYDFGDAIRFAANTAPEDEPNLSLVSLDLEKYEAFTSGFVGQTASAMTEQELETLYLGPIVMALELAARFLTDYLDGDKYFKCNYEKHNLVRAKCQAHLAMDMIAKTEITKQIIKKYAK